jgi:hypothetical protein
MANPDRTDPPKGRHRKGRYLWPALGLVVFLAPLPGGSKPPGQVTVAPTADSVWVTAGSHYRSGALHQFLFGTHYREVWTTPVQVEVLHLDRFDGGLEPTREGGGRQTRSLRFRSAAGRQFVFRSTDKSLRLLPDLLTRSLFGRVLQDGISASHPGAALVAATLQEAIGIPGAVPRLVVLPDHSRLGAFRSRYRGLLGTLAEEAPDRSPAAPKTTDHVLATLDTCPTHRVDASGFLTARLLDFLLNDWDRHRDQWDWVARQGDLGLVWEPIPVDRDQALAWYDGLVIDLFRPLLPKLVKFGPAFPSLRGLTSNSLSLDRRFLGELPRTTWDSVTRFVQERLTDEVLRRAVAGLPDGWRRQTGDLIVETLRERRARLGEISGAFYDRVH